MNRLMALVSVLALVFTSGCMNIPHTRVNFKSGTFESPKDDALSGLKVSYYNSNGVVHTTTELATAGATMNPAVITATGQVRAQDMAAVTALVSVSVEAALKGAAAYFSGGTSLLLPQGSGATATIPTTIPAVLPTPTPDSPTTLPAGAVVPPAQWRHYSNEYWLPIASLTATTQPPVGWKFSPAVAGPFCIAGTTQCYIAIVPQ